MVAARELGIPKGPESATVIKGTVKTEAVNDTEPTTVDAKTQMYRDRVQALLDKGVPKAEIENAPHEYFGFTD